MRYEIWLALPVVRNRLFVLYFCRAARLPARRRPRRRISRASGCARAWPKATATHSAQHQLHLQWVIPVTLSDENQRNPTKPNEMNDNRGLTDSQRRVIPFLLPPPSTEEACRRARINKTTVYEWFKDETFRQELKRQRDAKAPSRARAGPW